MLILKFIAAVILTEAITELVTKSEIFKPMRAKAFSLGKSNIFFDWLHRLLDCGYCFSVWSGVLVAFLLFRDLNILYSGLDEVMVGLILHRSANLFHNVVDRVHGI